MKRPSIMIPAGTALAHLFKTALRMDPVRPTEARRTGRWKLAPRLLVRAAFHKDPQRAADAPSSGQFPRPVDSLTMKAKTPGGATWIRNIAWE